MIVGLKEVLVVVKAPTVAAEETKSARVGSVFQGDHGVVYYYEVRMIGSVLAARLHLGWILLLVVFSTPFRVMCLLHRKN